MNIKEEARRTVAEMTLEEKAGICSGLNFWETKEIQRLGLKKHMLTDGPHGLRKQMGNADHLGINTSVPATSFPTAATTACSFDPDLMEKMGEALGDKCIRENVSVILGPGVNVKRSPLCGRNFEYFSEDPYLAGKIAAGLIRGVQKKGVGTSLKHFAANSQEYFRMVNNSVVDERALREVYFPAFEIAVKESQPWTVMCSYNKINGTYSSENRWLLEDVLRKEWGFEGLVVSDWGATANGVTAVESGMDLEMPGSGNVNAKRICDAVKNGRLSMELLDTSVRRIVEMYLKAQYNEHRSERTEEDDNTLAREIATQSAVLLKNDGMLPIKKDAKALFVGGMAKSSRYQGAGSSKICPSFLDNAYDAAVEAGVSVDYVQGYPYGRNGEQDPQKLLAEAVEAAKKHENIVIFAGLPDEYESEGYDRDNMKMPESHTVLIEELAKVSKNITVVLQCGSPVELPFKDSVNAILLMYLAGQASGHATVDLLTGMINPSGKLAETWPITASDGPSSGYFAYDTDHTEYRESIYVGYRFYDTAGVKVNYPFGYGLSYTTFEYNDLKVEKKDDVYAVSFSVRNTGNVFGREAVQVYVGMKDSKIFRAKKELKGFGKVALEPGETGQVSITLDRDAFRYYNTETKEFCVEGGTYEIMVGASSTDIRLSEKLQVEGDGKESLLSDKMKICASYFAPKLHFEISDDEFRSLLGYTPKYPDPDSKKVFTTDSSIWDIRNTVIGKIIINAATKSSGSLMDENADEGMKRMAERMLMSIPLRAMTMTGSMSLYQAEGIAELANGHVFRGLGKMIKK